MAATGKKGAYEPSMSDEAVKAKTGKTWPQWFAALDKAKAHMKSHDEIAGIVEKLGAGRWWHAMVTVEYERARGLREKHQTASGYSVSVSKTVACDLGDLFAAASGEALRKKWMPKGKFVESSQTKDKYWRGSWNGDARLEINFYAKGEGKSQITIQVNKLKEKDAVEVERAAWKAAAEKLVGMLT